MMRRYYPAIGEDFVIPPPPVTYGCGAVINGSWPENTAHDYGFFFLDTSATSLMHISWNTLGARPNKFILTDDTTGEGIASTDWVGFAPYAGVWGMSLGTLFSGTIDLVPVPGHQYKVQVLTSDGDPDSPSTDSWRLTLTCG